MSGNGGAGIDRRKVLKLGAVAGGAAWVAPSITSVAVAQAPGSDVPPAVPSVKGSGTATAGSTFTLAVDATGGTTPTGTVAYDNPTTGESFTGTVTCVLVNGNEGTVSGTVNPGAANLGGASYFRVGVQDNGTAGDVVRVVYQHGPYDCAVPETQFFGTVIPPGDFTVTA